MNPRLSQESLVAQFPGWDVFSRPVIENEVPGIFVQLVSSRCRRCGKQHDIKAMIFDERGVDEMLTGLRMSVRMHESIGVN